MIKKLTVCNTQCTDPYTNIAVEKYLTLNVGATERIMFLWRNDRTVVIGRNQSAYRECDVSRLEADGGHLARRLSGGGAVFHDLGNLNFTFISRKDNFNISEQLEIITDACRRLGINAEKSGRNDITVDGRKFSGNAFYRAGDCCYHHGTLLLRSDPELFGRYLKVDDSKLKAKGVGSVRSRICNLNEFRPDITPEFMARALEESFAEGSNIATHRLSVEELDTVKINEYRDYLSSFGWIFGRPIDFEKEIERRFEWGNVDIFFKIDHGTVSDAAVYSDAMKQDIAGIIRDALVGRQYRREDLADAARMLKVVLGSKASSDLELMMMEEI